MQFKPGARVRVAGNPPCYGNVVRRYEPTAKALTATEKGPRRTKRQRKQDARSAARDILKVHYTGPIRERYRVTFDFDGHEGVVTEDLLTEVSADHHLVGAEMFAKWDRCVQRVHRGYSKLSERWRHNLEWMAGAFELAFLNPTPALTVFALSFALPFISAWPYSVSYGPGLHRGNHCTTLVNTSSINFTGSWNACDTTAESDSESTTASTLTATNRDSNTWTYASAPPTVVGMAVRYFGQSGATGTITFSLYNSTDSTTVASVTLNASDLPSLASTNYGWIVLKFASSQLLVISKNYLLRINGSLNNNGSFYVSAGTNWSRQLITSTTQSPAANDKLIVAGEFTGAGTSNSFTVTNNNTATTTFGPVASGSFGMEIANKGTFTWGTSASTNYYLKLAGRLHRCSGGTWNMGTSGTPMPSTSTATLELVPASAVDTGMEDRAGAVVNAYGATIAVLTAKLTADAAAAATSLTTSVSTGWASGQVAIASTTRTNTESEKKTMSGAASGTSVPVAALTNAHSGTSNANGDIRAEVGLLTRNVVIKGTSTTLNSYWNIAATAVVNTQYCEYENLGSSTANKRGIDVATTSGTFNMQYCGLHDFTQASALGVAPSGVTSNFTYSNNVSYNIAGSHVSSPSANTSTYTVSGNLAILNTAALSLFSFGANQGTVTNNTAAGSAAGGFLFSGGISSTIGVLGTNSGNVAHSCATNGFDIRASGGTVTAPVSWRNSSNSLLSGAASSDVTIDSLVSFGNVNGVNFANQVNFIYLSPNIHAGTTLVATSGAQVSHPCLVRVYNGTFGSPGTHSSGDIVLSNSQSMQATVYLYNTTLSSTIEVSSNTSNFNVDDSVGVFSQKHDGVAGAYRAWKKYATVQSDTVVFDGASGKSVRIIPNTAGSRGRAVVLAVRVPSGSTCTPSVRAYKSVIGDGAAYNGNQPRLIVLKHIPAGITSDTVLATGVAANGSWETLTGTTAAVAADCILLFAVDCDGTAGFVSADNGSAVRSADPVAPGGMDYSLDGLPWPAWETAGGLMRSGGMTGGLLG